MNKLKSQKGMTIIEVVVSIAILTSTALAMSALANHAIKSGVVAEDRTKAYNLAQEVIEAAREVREVNWQMGFDWDKDLDTVSIFGRLAPKGYIYDSTLNQATKVVDKGTYVVKVKIDDMVVNLAEAGNRADFAGIGLKKKMTVTVDWAVASTRGTVQSETYLTDWKRVS